MFHFFQGVPVQYRFSKNMAMMHTLMAVEEEEAQLAQMVVEMNITD
jgi:hypothetical protein